jgi:hypothetical protein
MLSLTQNNFLESKILSYFWIIIYEKEIIVYYWYF